MSNLKAAVGEKEAAIIRKRLNAWAKSCNPTCADCCRTNPTWASVNLGVLVCLECAGRHRSLGTHISKMRSITLDTVLPEEAHFLLQMTNELANRYWEARLSSAERSQAQTQPSFVQQKYSDRKWVLQDASVPVPSRDCVPQSHPWWSAQDSSSAAIAAQSSNQPVPTSAAKQAVLSTLTLPKTSQPPVEASDLIDFGDSPQQAAVSAPSEPDPFASTEALAASSQRDLPDTADPFAVENNASAQPAATSTAAARTPQTPVDPFAAMSLNAPAIPFQAATMSHAASAPALPAPGPAVSSLSGGMPSGQHSRTPSGSSAMSAPSAAPFPGISAPAQAGASSGGPQSARKPQSKAEMNAHILSLYSRPSSSPGGMPGVTPQAQGSAAPPQQAGAGAAWANPAHMFAAAGPQRPSPARPHLPGQAVPGFGNPAQHR